ASDRGYRVVVLGDCCESITDEWHSFSVTQILPVVGEVAGAEDFSRAVDTERKQGVSD
ncbi:MAG: isochorismatase family protein, partial [Actinomycetota bacterium]